MIEIKITPDFDFKEDRAKLRSNLLSQLEAAAGWIDNASEDLCTKYDSNLLRNKAEFIIGDNKS